jgi:hypothetical protein
MKTREQQLKECSSVGHISADLPAVRNVNSTKTHNPHVSIRVLALLAECICACAYMCVKCSYITLHAVWFPSV